MEPGLVQPEGTSRDHTATPGTCREVMERMKALSVLSIAEWEDKRQQRTLKPEGSRLGGGKHFVPVRTVSGGDWLPREAVQSPTLDILQTCTDKSLRNLVWPHGFN